MESQKNKIIKRLLFVCAMFFCIAVSSAQEITTDSLLNDSTQNSILLADSITKPQRKPRTVTPVDIDDKKPQVVMHYYDKHGNQLAEPVMFLATLDTVRKPKSKPVYPLYNGVNIGANFADAIMMAIGQSYGSFGVWADVSLFNWLFPVVEAGIGFANSSPANSNYVYKTSPSFYTKLGFNYNFLYKSKPDYMFYLGFRAGYTNFKYRLEDVTISSDYWGETQQFNLNNLKASAVYGEALAGLRVKIYKRFSLGWSVRYHFKFKVNSKTSSTPWYIPGYGAKTPFAFNVSAIYTFGGTTVPEKGAEKTQ